MQDPPRLDHCPAVRPALAALLPRVRGAGEGEGQVRGLVAHPAWSPMFEVSAKLAKLTARWGAPCRVELDEFTGRFAVWRDECPLASGDTQLDAVEAALELSCAFLLLPC